MTLQQIRYAIVISDLGSMNKASEVLYISQPSLTSAIHDLEKEAGIKLFYRSGRGVTPTAEGEEFLGYARQVWHQYEQMMRTYGRDNRRKRKFGISTQHYSFATQAFINMARECGTDEYEFAIRETKTGEVIDDVAVMKSEIGILYLSDFNRKVILSLLKSKELEFIHLVDCDAYVYLWKGHPLAGRDSIGFEDLAEYPNLSFEQGAGGSFYFAEEILSTADYPRRIKANDRATMLNLMRGLNGYTLCSGIICNELNGGDYIAVPFRYDSDKEGDKAMEIGYIKKKNLILSDIARKYIEKLEQYLDSCGV